MKKIVMWIDTGYVGANYEDEVEFDDDASESLIDECARDFLNNHIDYGWYIKDETVS